MSTSRATIKTILTTIIIYNTLISYSAADTTTKDYTHYKPRDYYRYYRCENGESEKPYPGYCTNKNRDHIQSKRQQRIFKQVRKSRPYCWQQKLWTVDECEQLSKELAIDRIHEILPVKSPLRELLKQSAIQGVSSKLKKKKESTENFYENKIDDLEKKIFRLQGIIYEIRNENITMQKEINTIKSQLLNSLQETSNKESP